MEKIDFVMIWVDGSDPEWRKQFNLYAGKTDAESDTREERYRDWDNLRYWFRGVEKYAPWVNRIHFVTCGQIPEWLNLDNPKLHFVKHSDYIPEKYLPTFSSHPIEINMHQIEGLSDKFVYFNDDCFFINEVKPERFFKKGLPCERVGCPIYFPDEFLHAHHILTNNTWCINQHFSKKECIRKHFFKWFSLNYIKHPRCMLQTLLLLPYSKFSRFSEPHFPNSFLKATLEEVWEKCSDILEETSASRFRELGNVNQWLFRDWQIAKGDFYPYDVYKDSICYELCDENIPQVVSTIRSQRKNIIVMNDSAQIRSFDVAKKAINSALDAILPEKCSFEK
ncbi:MAG: Stealth CR1 domain-containing protein [Bacteroidaceae bacterium]|nr:Stealth CR1 domain-containing protein [Bacteroidaceae bacterium]